jgi:hypothetical protein
MIEETLPEAWNKIITEPDSLLVDLLSETTEKICGFKPETNEATQFLKTHKDRFLIPPMGEPPRIPLEPKLKPPALPGNNKISQEDLVPYIIKVLQKYGGRARKDQVDSEIYQLLKDIFQKPYYQETVAQGVPRWQHNIAWAKERAKNKGLIKKPEDSGRGYWELTSKGLALRFETS